MSALPLLLAGPILRRADPAGVWVWLATSTKVTSVSTGLSIPRKTRPGQFKLRASDYVALAEQDEHDFRCVQLGEKLFVSLVRMRPEKGLFRTDVIYSYTLTLTFDDGGWFGLEDLVDDIEMDLSYPPYDTPTFYLAGKDGVLGQASCRRPGAGGQDAFAHTSWWIQNWAQNPGTRPAALFLTGDQIYADDVAHSLFVAVRKLSLVLMGFDEQYPAAYDKHGSHVTDVPGGDIPYTKPTEKKKPHKAGYIPGDPVVFQGHGRRGNVVAHGFTTQDGEGHLLTFGEFAAMYLLVWNPKLCDQFELEADLAPAEWGGDPNLKGFTKAAHHARRVLANIPTYMIFDDHEVTDDWNMTPEWVEQTDNPFGRRLLSNALAAYWAFQDWGNHADLQGSTVTLRRTKSASKPTDPSSFLESHFDALRTSNGKSYRDHDARFETPMLVYHGWSYVAPTRPQVVVFDTRTSRYFSSVAFVDDEVVWDDYSSLINQEGLDRLKLLCSAFASRQPIVLVLATPLLPWKPLITLRSQSISFMSPQACLDIELGDLWSDHSGGVVEFLKWLEQTFSPRYCLVFSGDVHHGYVVKGSCAVLDDREQALWGFDIFQITSSPLKNQSSDLNKQIGLGWVSTTQVNLFEEFIDTAGTDKTPLDDGTWLALEYDIVKLDGRLGHDTVIPKNHVCFVSFKDPNRLVISFHGDSRSTSDAVIDL